MSASSSPEKRRRRERRLPRFSPIIPFLPWLDVLALLAWGALLLKYWVTDRINLLIHPNYIGLTVVTALALLAIGACKTWVLIQKMLGRRTVVPAVQHLSLFSPGWSSGLLLLVAIAGLSIPPRAFASQTAIHRGVNDSLTATRVKPQAFAGGISRSEDKSIIDWIRTLNLYPEPDAYTGQKAKVQGFAVHSAQWPEQYLLISRFVITCCAADVYPVGLPVKLPQNQKRSAFPADKWFEVEGQMITETFSGKRQLTIEAKSLKPIPEPKNPYDY